MAELGNCAACRQPFHDSPQQHACKGCGGKILTGTAPIPAGGACGGAGSPGGMEGVSPSESAGGTVPAPAQYNLITDLLGANMFKLYTGMLKSDKQRVKGGQPAKFGYLSMMAVDTLGAFEC